MQIYLEEHLCLLHNGMEGEKYIDMSPKVGCLDLILQLAGKNEKVKV